MLELENVNAYYGDSHILHGVSLAVNEGEVVCLLGRNGAGKTTTILTIMGYLSRGRADPLPWRESRRCRPTRSRGSGSVSCRRSAAFSRALRCGRTSPCSRARAGGGRWTLKRILELFPSLRARERNLGFQLSGGEQQMLSIARALMLNPSCCCSTSRPRDSRR